MPAPYSDDLRIKAITAVERGERKYRCQSEVSTRIDILIQQPEVGISFGYSIHSLFYMNIC